MKIDMKQRIIGIVVIIALAVILIPLFVSQYQHDEIIKQAQISQQPETPNVNSVNQLQALNSQITEQAQDKVDWQALQPASVAQTSPTQDTSVAQTNNAESATTTAAAPAQPTSASPEALQANPEMNVGQAQAIAANSQPQEAQPNANASSANQETSIASNETQAFATTVEEKPAVAEPTQPKAKNVDKPKTTKLSKSAPNSYLVQLGNFSSKKNAAVLKNRLEKHGFHPSIEENHGHFRVLVGPATSHEKAAQKLQLIAQKLHVSGFLVKA